MEFSRKQIEDLLVQIYSGEISVRNLPVNLVYAIYEYLNDAMVLGLKEFELKLSIEDYLQLKNDLSINLFLFATAKTFQFVLSTRELIYEGGKIVPLNEYKKKAKENYNQYYNTWSEAEYDTAFGQSQNAGHWQTFNRNRFAGEYLMYDAILDMNTSDICRPLDGIVRHIDDPFWDVYMPANHYRCRCTVKQVNMQPTDDAKVFEATQNADAKMQDLFRTNVGKTKEVFDKDHPYFNIPNEYKALARSNFNVPIPKTLLKDGE